MLLFFLATRTIGVSGVGLIMLAMVLNQVGLPVEGIALIMGVDRLLDMMRTAVNITGDAVAAVIMAKSEGALDHQIYLTFTLPIIMNDNYSNAWSRLVYFCIINPLL